ncbi:LuxR family maltose regulon positive regulatory protein [Paenibacillus rhizosphaerae]|uniref:LuxR family maltose regulon positive regulatory protein n=1 Tax=Paenibacillus rhizosphaerae TaxID=297318 RepID=A0A839TTU1_9BACL|nr:LuxR C-terminal-related transcriptional regulator [Paenibacillus rhizosphaerae]MBB3128117.1 LuxR family maltose regulon positive regulatory protein [Paenibacillus rhizosphaerae]
MSIPELPVLSAKLYIPQPRTRLVARPHLVERLKAGLGRKLTLISASAGFGKTTLISEWAAGCERPVAWISLDERDKDSLRLLTLLVAALQTIEQHCGEAVMRAIQCQPQPEPETMLTMLLNEISTMPFEFVLVLDDYHAVGDREMDHTLTFLIEHLPPQMHLVIATRENPQLSLSRLRAGGHLTELRDADLRFTAGEAAEFLNQVMELRLSVQDIAALDHRTEGWIAGLQLAALSMQGRNDIPAFIRSFAGDNRYIVDYLVEEVLQRQPADVRNFLLQTSILDRLHGPLCDAVTGQKEGAARLQSLEQGSFFIVPLDDRRQWYRYHHLFGEVLSIHLRTDQPDLIPELHRRASDWYGRHGSYAEAIGHALAAEDFPRAADLIEQAWPAIRMSRQEAAVLGWIQALPGEMVRRRPVLSVEYAWALLAVGQTEGAEERLNDAERWLEDSSTDRKPEYPATGMIYVDEEEFRRLPGTIAGYRAAYAQARGDIPAAIQYSKRVLELVPADDYLRRGAAAALLGLASWTSGDLQEAYRMFSEGMANVRRAGNISDAIGGSIALADISIAQGRLHQAMHTFQNGLQLAAEMGTPEMRGTADMYVGISELCREQGDLDAAIQYLLRSQEQGEHLGLPQYPYRWRAAMARIRQSQGDLNGALEMLHEAEQQYVGDFFPNVRPVAALKVRVWLALNRWNEAAEWVHEQGLSTSDDLHYLREFEHITLARVLLYRHPCNHTHIQETLEFLERLSQAAADSGRTGSRIEILMLQALAHHSQSNISSALAPLELALTLAEPERYVRIFADEGQSMAALLEAALTRGICPNYVRLLLRSFGKGEGGPAAKKAVGELLSERERDVLRLLKTDLSGPEIARELHVSLNTLRTHTKNIYDKLEVNNRRAAVRRAEELDDVT